MTRVSMEEWKHDRHKMEQYIIRHLPKDEQVEIVLANDLESGPLTAKVDVIDWGNGELGLHYESDDPDAVDLRDIYDYFRLKEMTMEEWRQECHRGVAQMRIDTLQRKVASLRQARTTIANNAKRAIDAATETDLPGEDNEVDMSLSQFQLSGEYWLLRFAGEEGRCRDLEGFRHIAKLLAAPDKDIEALVLQGEQDCPIAHEYLSPQMAIDDLTLITQKMSAIEVELAQAEVDGDPADIVDLREQHDALTAYMTQGQHRRLGGTSAREKARKAVGNAISRAVQRIRNIDMPELARFLDRSILPNGTTFTYSPCHPRPNWIL